MTLTEILLILSTLISPFLAVYAQKSIERWRHRHDQKVWIFKTLMGTRAATLAPNHVQALNMIDLEFVGSSAAEVNVRQLWREYLDQLGSLPENADKHHVTQWNLKNLEHLVSLLVAMGKCVGYEFDPVYIRKSIYSPKGHETDENESRTIRLLLLQLLRGERSLGTDTKLVPVNAEAAATGERMISAITSVFEGRSPIKVKPTE